MSENQNGNVPNENETSSPTASPVEANEGNGTHAGLLLMLLAPIVLLIVVEWLRAPQ